MVYVLIISNFMGALSIFPLAYIGKKLLDKKSLIILMILFAFSRALIVASTSGYPEPLFNLLFLFAIYFTIKAKENPSKKEGCFEFFSSLVCKRRIRYSKGCYNLLFCLIKTICFEGEAKCIPKEFTPRE